MASELFGPAPRDPDQVETWQFTVHPANLERLKSALATATLTTGPSIAMGGEIYLGTDASLNQLKTFGILEITATHEIEERGVTLN